MPVIEVDRHTVIQVLGSLMQSPKLLSDIDKYSIEPNDFKNYLDKVVFSAIYNLYVGGAEKIHAVDINSYLEDNLPIKKYLEENNGIQFLQDCETNADINNFNYYYLKLKKFNLLRDLSQNGKDISKIYPTDLLDVDYAKKMEIFEKLSPTDIINSLKGELADLEKKYVLNSVVEETRASDDIRSLVESLKTKPEIGVRLQGNIFNTVTRGGRKGKFYLRSAGSGVGKALPNSTRIPTPDGWKLVGEIKAGDLLFDRFGNPTKVLKVFPQQEKKKIYKVYFKSGRVAECCDEHLWSYYSNKNDKNPNELITATLRDIIDNPRGLRDTKGCYRWSIPVTEPVKYPEKSYSVDPYVMGLILGDGSFRYNLSNKSFSFSSTDEELVKAICNRQRYLTYKKNSDHNYNWSFELVNQEKHKNVWVEDILSEYPELWQLKSEDKYIPQEFLLGSVEQRYDLLAGLLDTDGSIDEKGRIGFTTISPILRDNIIELCESLGLTCNYSTDIRNDKYTTGECYNLHIQAPKTVKPKLFKLKRKLDIAIAYANNGKREERRDRDSIIKIEPTEEFVDMTCFYVDNDEHLFLMNNYICTHNTRSMVADACNIAYPVRYEPALGKWVFTGVPEKVLYVMTEQDPAEIQTMVLSYLTGYNEEIFTYGMFGEAEQERIDIAIELMEKYSDFLLFARIPDPCASVVKNLFRRYCLQEKVSNIFYDYIFSSPAMLSEYRDLGLREDVCLRLMATTIKNLAVELDAFIMSATQTSNDNEDGGFKDFRNIRGSKAIADLADVACIRRRPSEEELSLVKEFEKAYNITPNCVTDVFKNRRGRWTQVSIWSYLDLGIMRNTDLFVTSASLKPIDDFKVIDFISKTPEEYKRILAVYNKGLEENIFPDNMNISKNKITVFKNNNFQNAVEELQEAFGNKEQQKQRVKDLSFGDLI